MSKINFKSTSETTQVRAAENRRAIPEKQTQTVKNKTAGEDKAKFSDRAAQVGKLVDNIKEVPDIRLDRVNALRDKIAAGEYKVESSNIADAILKDES